MSLPTAGWRRHIRKSWLVPANFWALVNKDGPEPRSNTHLGRCWLFGKGTHRYTTAYRYAFELSHRRLADDELVLHRCANGHITCVNPAHLKAGSYYENSRDTIADGHQPTGEKCGGSIWSNDQVLMMRTLRNANAPIAWLQDLFGGSTCTVQCACGGWTYKRMPSVSTFAHHGHRQCVRFETIESASAASIPSSAADPTQSQPVRTSEAAHQGKRTADVIRGPCPNPSRLLPVTRRTTHMHQQYEQLPSDWPTAPGDDDTDTVKFVRRTFLGCPLPPLPATSSLSALMADPRSTVRRKPGAAR